jgi:hypothetical protein
MPFHARKRQAGAETDKPAAAGAVIVSRCQATCSLPEAKTVGWLRGTTCQGQGDLLRVIVDKTRRIDAMRNEASSQVLLVFERRYDTWVRLRLQGRVISSKPCAG